MTTNILRKRELSKRLGVSETTIWRWVRAGLFPKPITLGPNTIGWDEETQVQPWLEAKRND
jgi:prophage regulatory protein